MDPKVSVIVVGTNEKNWLTNCFQSLCQSTYNNLLIIFVDNCSSDNSSALVSEQFPSVHIISNQQNLGFAGGNNVGIKYAIEQNSKYIFLVNPDTQTPVELISHLTSFMEKNRSFGVVGPLQAKYSDDINELSALNEWSLHAIENEDKHPFHHWEPWRPRVGRMNEEASEEIIEHAYVQGAAMFFRADLIDKIGYLDEIFHTYYEETDFCRKARWVNFRVALIPKFRIQHYGGGGSQNKSYYRNYHYSRNKYIYLWTEPEYSWYEIIRLSSRWLIHDLKAALSKKPMKDVTDLNQLRKIVGWLLSNFRHLKEIRYNNKELYTS